MVCLLPNLICAGRARRLLAAPPNDTLGARPSAYGSVRLQLPKDVNGRAGQGCALFTVTSWNVRAAPAVSLSANPARRYSRTATASSVASSRLPAFRFAPVSMAGPSYQSRTAPELRPPPEHVLRTDTRIASSAPSGTVTGVAPEA